MSETNSNPSQTWFVPRKQSLAIESCVISSESKWKVEICVDSTDLNKITSKEEWPIPNIQLLLNRIGDKKPNFFMVLDLLVDLFTQAWQI
jgi:predicted RNA-binding protein YlqC (UPF0109 family)